MFVSPGSGRQAEGVGERTRRGGAEAKAEGSVVLYGAGPRTIEASNAKRADENLVLEDLRKATRVVACAVADLLA